jgi:hypothetical protein
LSTNAFSKEIAFFSGASIVSSPEHPTEINAVSAAIIKIKSLIIKNLN